MVTRNDVSKRTLFELLDYANYRVFDLNLSPPYYNKELLIQLMNKADFIKFNDDELYEVSAYLILNTVRWNRTLDMYRRKQTLSIYV